ncbi:hypothetical protein QCA50_007233 [Cerrena zonata]|uniref:SET domain-containing protein n=1 Tax=Cerrena zonata TaxID=2478898 RepID=A0AAW0G9H4_9APHY
MTPPSLHKSTLAQDTTTHAKIKIPSKPPPSSDDIPTTLTKNTTTNTLFTTLPPYNDARPNEPITECIIRPEIKDTILAIPGFPHPFTTPDPPRYEIKLIRGAGMGMVATVDLDVGDVILAERPLLVTTQLLQRAGQLPWQHPHHLQRMVVERMPKETAEEFFALHNCKGYTQPSITGIFNTNAIGIGALPGYPADCGAVCKVISRVNHSCSPTATWAFHVESFAVQLRAILPIRKGEEVFVNYGTRGQRLEERQQYLLRRYKFKCACPPVCVPVSRK